MIQRVGPVHSNNVLVIVSTQDKNDARRDMNEVTLTKDQQKTQLKN